MRDLERTNAGDDLIEACIALRMADHGRVRGLQLAMEEHGAHALEVWQRMQLIHTLGIIDGSNWACGEKVGTTSGAARHYRAHEKPCDECRTAVNHANQKARRRKEHAA